MIRESEAFDKELQQLEDELAEADEETRAAISA